MGIAEVITLLVAISGLMTGIFALRKSDAEAEKITEEITDMVLQRAKIQLDELRTCITDLEGENTTLRQQIERLNAKIADQDRCIRELKRENQEYRKVNNQLRQRVKKLEKDTGELKLDP